MNNIGYTWVVQNKDTLDDVTSGSGGNSITVSFFDRSLNTEYHFTDYHNFDLASMNQRGVLLGQVPQVIFITDLTMKQLMILGIESYHY